MADAHNDKHDAGGGGGHDEHAKGGHKSHGGGHGHGGGHAEHEEGVPEWVVSFADNALLQMGFFVIMFAMNVGPKGGGEGSESPAAGPPPSFLDAMVSIREAFNGKEIDAGSARDDELQLLRHMQKRKSESENTDEGTPGDNENKQSQRPTGFNNINATVPFDLDSPTLSTSGRSLIGEVARELRGKRWIVEVRGHTDLGEPRRRNADAAAPGAGPGAAPGAAPVNPIDGAMRLSYDRAFAAALVLVENGLTWDQIRIVACGPASPRTDASGGANRRVEIIDTREPMAADRFSKDPNSGKNKDE
jgi:outer membrane protein OmpA-like peptidoglycan-associated protein